MPRRGGAIGVARLAPRLVAQLAGIATAAVRRDRYAAQVVAQQVTDGNPLAHGNPGATGIVIRHRDAVALFKVVARIDRGGVERGVHAMTVTVVDERSTRRTTDGRLFWLTSMVRHPVRLPRIVFRQKTWHQVRSGRSY